MPFIPHRERGIKECKHIYKKEALYHVEILKGRLSKQATLPSYGYQDISPTWFVEPTRVGSLGRPSLHVGMISYPGIQAILTVI